MQRCGDGGDSSEFFCEHLSNILNNITCGSLKEKCMKKHNSIRIIIKTIKDTLAE